MVGCGTVCGTVYRDCWTL